MFRHRASRPKQPNINVFQPSFELSENDVRLPKLFRQTVQQRWPGGGNTAVTELVAWPLDSMARSTTFDTNDRFETGRKLFMSVESKPGFFRSGVTIARFWEAEHVHYSRIPMLQAHLITMMQTAY